MLGEPNLKKVNNLIVIHLFLLQIIINLSRKDAYMTTTLTIIKSVTLLLAALIGLLAFALLFNITI